MIVVQSQVPERVSDLVNTVDYFLRGLTREVDSNGENNSCYQKRDDPKHCARPLTHPDGVTDHYKTEHAEVHGAGNPEKHVRNQLCRSCPKKQLIRLR